MKRKAAALFLLLSLIMICFVPSTAIWAESTVSISIQPKGTIAVGDSITAIVSFSSNAQNIEKVTGVIQYDDTILQFHSGDATGGSGQITIEKRSADTATQSLTLTLHFTAKKAGLSSLSLINSAVYSDEVGEPLIGHPVASTSVTVTSLEPSPSLSSNANLSSLTASKGTLSPAFSPEITQYTVNVEHNVTTFPITARTADSSAKVEVSGANSLEVGTNKKIISVTAEDGTQKVYTITIIRKAAASTPKPTQKPTVTKEPARTTPPAESTPSPTLTETPDNTASPATQVPVSSPSPSMKPPRDETPFETLKKTLLTILVIVALVIIIGVFTVVYIIKVRDKRKKRGTTQRSGTRTPSRNRNPKNKRR